MSFEIIDLAEGYKATGELRVPKMGELYIHTGDPHVVRTCKKGSVKRTSVIVVLDYVKAYILHTYDQNFNFIKSALFLRQQDALSNMKETDSLNAIKLIKDSEFFKFVEERGAMKGHHVILPEDFDIREVM